MARLVTLLVALVAGTAHAQTITPSLVVENADGKRFLCVQDNKSADHLRCVPLTISDGVWPRCPVVRTVVVTVACKPEM